MIKRIVAVLLVAFTFAFSVPIGAYATEIESDFAWKDLDATPVQDDLKGFDFSKYIKNISIINPSIVAVAEQGFSQQTDYKDCALYIYVYNPTGKAVKARGLNKLQVKHGSSQIKVNLSYINSTDTIIKFRVNLSRSFFEKLNTKKRIYEISSLELQYVDGSIKDYKIGGTYTFTGFDENTKLERVDTFEVVSLDINYTTFRNTSDLGRDYRNQLTSVYFAVPDYLTEKYNGELYGIDCTYEKYYTKPIVVTNNKDVYDVLSGLKTSSLDLHSNKKLEDTVLEGMYRYSSKVPLTMYSGSVYEHTLGGSNGVMEVRHDFKWSFNYDMSKFGKSSSDGYWNYTFYFDDNYEQSYYLPIYIHQEGDFDRNYLVSQETVQKKINDFYLTDLGKDSFYKTADLDYYHRLLLEDYIIEMDGTKTPLSVEANKIVRPITFDDKPYNMISYDESHNFWEKFKDFGFKVWFTGLENDKTYKDISPVQPVKTSDLNKLSYDEIYEKYCIGKDEISDFVVDAVKAEALGKTLYLFRLDVAPYYSLPVSYTLNGEEHGTGEVFMCQEPVYMGFDVLDLMFKKENGEIVKVAVSADPENLVGSLEPSLKDEVQGDFDNIKDAWKDAIKRILQIIAFVIVLVLFIYLYTVIRDFVKLLSKKTDHSNKRPKRKRGKRK